MMTDQVNYAHDDLHKKFMDSDILKWTEEIDIIDVEMIFYRNLLNAHLQDFAAWDEINYEGLFQGITDVQSYNLMFKSTFVQYSNRLVAMAECDDLQCENYFLNEHAQLKERIEGHFSSYKIFKKTLLTHLKN